MSELIWINGEVMPLAEARIGVEDRGFQFADGVYEVIRLYKGKPFTLDQHLERLRKSADGIELKLPVAVEQLRGEITRFISRGAVGEGMIYLQLTRGAAGRNHAFPDCRPTLLFYARVLEPLGDPEKSEGIRLITVADERWKRCWVKSIALLPNVLAKNKALAAGADEAVFLDHGVVTECSASNIFIIRGRRLLTHPVGAKVLPGITRAVLLELAPSVGLSPAEEAFSEDEAIHADEVFITSTTREISWVSRWDQATIGGAKCPPQTLALHRALRERVAAETA
jgi:D-alanine transaminase